ncbi:putative CD209 antigen-like [Triplophysa rosa]|uniref:CD209 antigen-like n=2 Tax=Triplophysa rosa TaxID=992332 RepID=A0A9W7WBP0_TRIRA|nr:putative CD209 antigen-like [Triplophysa rosa]
MDGDDGKDSIDDIYINFDTVSSETGKETADSNTTRTKSHEITVKEPARNRSPRSVLVCLVVLCVLLLTAVIVLCVKPNLERDQLILKINGLTEDKTNLFSKCENLTNERDQLKREKAELQTSLGKMDGWIYYQSHFYFISSELLGWSESRRYCRERGADLIIIDNREEEDFILKTPGTYNSWMGLSDFVVDDRWKWVDGSALNFTFWRSGEPNVTKNRVDCILSTTAGWAMYPCNYGFKWICEKLFSK